MSLGMACVTVPVYNDVDKLIRLGGRLIPLLDRTGPSRVRFGWQCDLCGKVEHPAWLCLFQA